MIQNNNAEVSLEIVKALKVQLVDGIPTNVNPSIVPTIEVNPQIVKNGFTKVAGLTNATSATIYTTPTNQDFYLTGISMQVHKDATSPQTQLSVQCNEDGFGTVIALMIRSLTLTAFSGETNHTFSHPIKIARNSSFTLVSDSATANFQASATISGFLDEKANG